MVNENMRVLDNLETYSVLDPTGFGGRVAALPEQCLSAWKRGLEFGLPYSYSDIQNVVVLGVGGSAIGGELLADLVSYQKGLPVTVCRDYHLPSHLGEDSLVIASSYSGNTEETLEAFYGALKRKAKLVVVTTGGRLEQAANKDGIPVFKIDYLGEPRTALGYSLLIPLAILQTLNLIAPIDLEVLEAAKVLTSVGNGLKPQIPINSNTAKDLAISLFGKLIVVYGGGVLSGVARRWKTQFNENAKAWAFVEFLPEAGHNAIAGLERPHGMGGKIHGLLLGASNIDPRLKLRYEVIGELLGNAGVKYSVVNGVGNGVLSQMLSVVLVGDYVSYYLALLNGRDPSPVPTLNYLKSRLQSMH